MPAYSNQQAFQRHNSNPPNYRHQPQQTANGNNYSQQWRMNNGNQNRNFGNSNPNSNQVQNRSSFNQNKPQYSQPQQRTYHMHYEQPLEEYDPNYSFQHELNSQSYGENTVDHFNQETFDIPVHTNDYQDFLTLPTTSQPPENDAQDPVAEIQSHIQTLNLDNMDPNLNFPEQHFI